MQSNLFARTRSTIEKLRKKAVCEKASNKCHLVSTSKYNVLQRITEVPEKDSLRSKKIIDTKFVSKKG